MHAAGEVPPKPDPVGEKMGVAPVGLRAAIMVPRKLALSAGGHLYLFGSGRNYKPQPHRFSTSQ